MSTASVFLNSLYAGKGLTKKTVTTSFLTATENLSLQESLRSDSASFFYSSGVTFTSAIRALDNKHGSWATVQLYYSVFYSLRAWLATKGICLFHFDEKAFLIEAIPGNAPSALSRPSTHEAVFTQFRKHFSTDVAVTSDIDLVPALSWLKRRREEANYRTERFPDPGWLPHLKVLEQYPIRKLCETYLGNPTIDWRFDKEHAMVALPLDILKRTRGRLESESIGVPMSREEKKFLSKAACDSKGPLQGVLQSVIGE